MRPYIAALAQTPDGRAVLEAARQVLAVLHERGLRSDTQDLLIELMGSAPEYALKDIATALGEYEKPRVVVALNITDDHLHVHVDRRLGPTAVELLETDDPDSGRWEGRGLPHPNDEHKELMRSPDFETHELK